MAAPAHVTRQQPLRLTARGRRVLRVARWSAAFAGLVVAAVLIVVLVSSALAPGAVAGDWSATAGTGAAAAPAAGSDTVEVVVAPGDTLWDLARRHAPDVDPREFVAEVYRINDLPESGLVRAGERLVLPVS